MVDNESVEQICGRIREDGEKEVASILKKASQTAAEIVSKAEARGKAAAEKILKEAGERGGLARRRLLSSVNLEVRRAQMRAREEIVSSVNERVSDALEDVRKQKGYPGALAKLTVEAVLALKGDRFIVFADRRDVALFEKQVFPRVIELGAAEGKRVRGLEVKELDEPSLGGVRVGVPGGKVIYDNTFEARLYRFRDEVRNVIFKEVFAGEGSGGSSGA